MDTAARRGDSSRHPLEGMMGWLSYALMSAVAAALTAVLAKRGVEGVASNLATAVRTGVVMIFAWGIVLALGQHRELGSISKRSWIYLALSGCATGASWLAYFKALQLGPASRVAPIDKLSLPLTIVLAVFLLHEAVSWKVIAGVALMTLGALLTLA